MKAAKKKNEVDYLETETKTREEFLTKHNKLSPGNLRANGDLLARFCQEKPGLCADANWSLEKLRRPFIIWLTAQSCYKKSKERETINNQKYEKFS